MAASFPCPFCKGGYKVLGVPMEPSHCYGASDRPAPPGVLGGYRCSCPCRKEASASPKEEGGDGS